LVAEDSIWIIPIRDGSASESAGQPNEAWLKAAKAMKTEDELEFKIVLVTSEMAREHQDIAAMKKDKLTRMLDRLKSFEGISSHVMQEIERQISGIAT
jgi:hypothetical protein